MKTLFVIRHAKSSWDNSSLSDHDRPLNSRGNHDAPQMGKKLKDKNIPPDLMLSSPANRAYTTCTIMANELHYPSGKIKPMPNLYHANERTLLDVVQNLQDHHKLVMLFGHNPGLTDFVNRLTNQLILNIPTCGVAQCEFHVNCWKDVDWKKGELVFYDFPKK